jgi:hypothetical protein
MKSANTALNAPAAHEFALIPLSTRTRDLPSGQRIAALRPGEFDCKLVNEVQMQRFREIGEGATVTSLRDIRQTTSRRYSGSQKQFLPIRSYLSNIMTASLRTSRL